jgi:hypothetical protein
LQILIPFGFSRAGLIELLEGHLLLGGYCQEVLILLVGAAPPTPLQLLFLLFQLDCLPEQLDPLASQLKTL